jgi:hypothetical protein
MQRPPLSRRSFLRGALATLAAPAVVGCASLNAYRSEPTVARSRYATIENYGTAPVDPAEVDGLLEEVARVMKVELRPSTPRARIVVTTPTRIASLYEASGAGFPGHSRAAGLYFPGASLLLVPQVDRQVLGHELAHYLTDHYLKQVPRRDWEAVAHDVERRLA